MEVNVFPLGELQANCVLLSCPKTKEAMVFDIGGNPTPLINYIKNNNLIIKAVVCTHGHADHIGGIPAFINEFPNSELLIHKEDAEMLVDPVQNMSVMFGPPIICPTPTKFLKEGDELKIGEYKIDVFHSPGHSPGSLIFYIPKQNDMKNPILVAGDVIFNMSIGRTDFPGGSYEILLDNIMNKIMVLPDETIIYSGHGPYTKVGFEKERNPFLR